MKRRTTKRRQRQMCCSRKVSKWFSVQRMRSGSRDVSSGRLATNRNATLLQCVLLFGSILEYRPLRPTSSACKAKVISFKTRERERETLNNCAILQSWPPVSDIQPRTTGLHAGALGASFLASSADVACVSSRRYVAMWAVDVLTEIRGQPRPKIGNIM
jgi:hypothetical protein